MGGSSKQQTKETTTNRMPANQQRNVDQLMQGALDYYNSGGREYFPGDAVANFNPYQLAGQDYLLNYAGQGGAGANFAEQALAGNQFFMDPNNIMNLDNIPGYRGAQDATTQAYTRNLTENILPSVRSGGTSAGQFGGSASGIGEALSVDRTTGNIADALTNMDLGAYTQGLNAFNQAQNRAPSLFQLGGAPGTVMAGIGDATQQQEQREIDSDFARHMFAQNEPLFNLNALQGLTGQYGQYGGTTDSTSTTTQSSGGSGLQQALGLGLMGLSMMNPATAALGPLSGSLGGAGSVLSSGLGGGAPDFFRRGSTPGAAGPGKGG